MLARYIPKVRAFLTWGVGQRVLVSSVPDLDKLLADYLEHLCYGEECGFDSGNDTYYAFLALFPEFQDQLPVISRALKGWEKLRVGGEGEPIVEEVVMVLAEHFRRQGKDDFALIVETSMDVYWRQGEWEQLRHCDILDDDMNIAFAMGVAARGEPVKTSHNQGVIVDSRALTDEWRARKDQGFQRSVACSHFPCNPTLHRP